MGRLDKLYSYSSSSRPYQNQNKTKRTNAQRMYQACIRNLEYKHVKKYLKAFIIRKKKEVTNERTKKWQCEN